MKLISAGKGGPVEESACSVAGSAKRGIGTKTRSKLYGQRDTCLAARPALYTALSQNDTAHADYVRGSLCVHDKLYTGPYHLLHDTFRVTLVFASS